ncbi:Hypothetical predicted protein [Paramuricea clavata]|uniref:Uncharacterized protein n=1 Tax=Paramuricea clavata TaxID=317549 RepID=A0A6S7H6S7_PARCT|nr:Hypothetical predicted protein [Paramuricea clavata]
MEFRKALFVLLLLCATILGENRTMENDSNSEKRTKGSASCQATGDPHYRTFDEKRYNFMGMCEYVLSKDLENSFQVLAKNERCNRRYNCVASVTVLVKGLKLKISRGGRFTVFGFPKKLPYIKQGKNDPHSDTITTSVAIAQCNELV